MYLLFQIGAKYGVNNGRLRYTKPGEVYPQICSKEWEYWDDGEKKFTKDTSIAVSTGKAAFV